MLLQQPLSILWKNFGLGKTNTSNLWIIVLEQYHLGTLA